MELYRIGAGPNLRLLAALRGINWSAAGCSSGRRSAHARFHHHRTHTCRRCGRVVYTPPMTAECTDSSFDGRAR